MRRSRELALGAGVAVTAVIATLLLLEGAVRWFHLLPDRFWEPDPVLGSRLIPGKEGWWTQEEREFVVRVRINADGFRDVSHRLERTPGTTRILLLGDSFVEAMQVPLEATVGRRLEAELRARGHAAEVISMGVSAFGTAGELLLYRQRGRRYHPDLVVLAFYPGNDVRNNSPDLEDVLVPQYGTDGDILRLVPRRRQSRRGGWLGHSKLYRYARWLLLTRHPGLVGWLHEAGWTDARPPFGERRQDGIPTDYGVYAVNLEGAWEEAWEHTRRMLDRLAAEVREDGARLAVIVVAGREQVEPGVWDEILASYPAMRHRAWDLDGPTRRLLRWCENRSVPCLDLTPAFREKRRQGIPLHFRHDGHWNAEGHALAARVTAPFLERLLVGDKEQRRIAG